VNLNLLYSEPDLVLILFYYCTSGATAVIFSSMKLSVVCYIFLFSAISACADNIDLILKQISQKEAEEIVQNQEQAKERAKDEKEAKLRSASIYGTAVADMGATNVEFNRVKLPQKAKALPSQSKHTVGNFDKAAFLKQKSKEQLSFLLSGTVRDGISELWWQYENFRFKIFSNANFLYLSGVPDYQSEDTVYSVFPIIIEGNPEATVPNNGWRPTASDFTPGQLEYIIVQSSNVEAIDAEAFKPIELMLIKYGEEYDQLKIAYENAIKLRDAKVAYLEANPPKKRDTIINFAPIDKAARNTQNK